MKLKTIKDIDPSGKKILVRCDFDVPIKKLETPSSKLKTVIEDDTRIKKALPTIQHLLSHKANKVILIAHLNRPPGKIIKDLSLKPIAEKLKEFLNSKYQVSSIRYQGFESFEVAPNLILLENIRFYPEEEKNDPAFSKKLASLGDIFVMEAFGTAHRAHSSIVGLAKFLPTVAGFQIASEISALEKILQNPAHPFVMIMGGAKIADKIEVISNLLPQIDYLLVGGGIANTFLASLGYGICRSLIDPEKIPLASHLLKKYHQKIILPQDLVIAEKIAPKAKTVVEDTSTFPRNICESPHSIVDIGPRSIKKFSEIIKKAQTLLWNGPLGLYEISKFASGTRKIGKVFEKVASEKAYGLVGGGDVVAALEKLGLISGIDYISTGGGAMLEYLAGKKLPGLEILKRGT